MKNNKQVLIGAEAREKLINGVNKLADAVTATLGPGGRNALYEENLEIKSTKDGVSIAKYIELEDPAENIGAQMIKQASIKTAEVAGDGTTTSTLLAQHIVNTGLQLLNKGENVTQLTKGIEYGANKVIERLNTISRKIKDVEDLKYIANISTNGDSELSEMIVKAFSEVGADGVVSIEESKTAESYVDTVEGIRFERGFKSPYFVTSNSEMSSILDEALVLLYNSRITTAKELIPLLQHCASNNKSLLIIAEDIEGEALSTLIVNKMKGIVRVCAVKAPDFGDRRTYILEDIAVITGGKVLSPNKGNKLEALNVNDLGKCRKAVITKFDTTIIDGAGSEESITSRGEEIKKQIEDSKSSFEIEQLQQRLANLSGGVSIVYVGGINETQMNERKDRADDALNAVKAAFEKGIVPGGGCALIKASKILPETVNKTPKEYLSGCDIVYNACFKPFHKILQNATGYEADQEVIDYILKNNTTGFDVLKNEKISDMYKKGVIDPLKVSISALKNAVAAANVLLLTETVIVENKEESQDNIQQQMMSHGY